MTFSNIRSFLKALRSENELVDITAPVNPYLEIPEIHRRTVSGGGPALMFKNVNGSRFPVVTNLFGTKKRVDLAFGSDGPKLLAQIAALPHEFLPPTAAKVWRSRSLFKRILSAGTSRTLKAPVLAEKMAAVDLTQLPALTTWKLDGGPFFTLPLVYTEDPASRISNLGMYRMHRYDKTTTGMHFQINKGGGFHLARAGELGLKLPVNVAFGGPPLAILGAIAPLPENVPELMLTSLLLGSRLKLARAAESQLPIMAEAEFTLIGSVDPHEVHPEGPFGDHYGYYSLQHDFPVFRCNAVYHRPDAIFPATVVGKPRQEDFYIGNYLQELLSPLFPLVMPAVKDLWSYGETGYHSLAAAVVRQRYKREAMVSAFRILGEGQLSLTKFLLVLDRDLDLKDFKAVLEYVLERSDFRSDLYVFSNLSMDTLDYTGPTLNHGSKGVLLGVGDPIRQPPGEFQSPLPTGINSAAVFCRGCLVVSGSSYSADTRLAAAVAADPAFAEWPLVILVDNAGKAASSIEHFLWTTFTRFEPAADIYSSKTDLIRFHPSPQPPIVIDARMKPSYPDELECDEDTARMVDRRWREYFPAK